MPGAVRFPDRFRTYAAGWDSKEQRVTGLEAWGQQVLNDLWDDLSQVLSDRAKARDVSSEDEETQALAVRGRIRPVWLEQEEAAGLLDCRPTANLPIGLAKQELTLALEFLREHKERLKLLARERADALLADHRRIREAARDIGQYSVRPNLPVDLIGVYVLLPDSL